ncbi:unnamed protein product [Symbiodinium natans]|uniref:EcxA zinc-binding domain-containing protein n=1 Tax=Symbiodinium natans TaxID=878477 RepID=A0A812KP85_9DINO|nr:unnamed protein product [Symbiodinium natans]
MGELVQGGARTRQDPITYFEQLFAHYVAVSANLLEPLCGTILVAVAAVMLMTSVAPEEPLDLYGEAVTDLLGRVESLAHKVVSWVGGIKDGYVHRGKLGDLPQRSRQPISSTLQQRALVLLFRLLRPQSSGLLPPRDNLPYLVQGSASHDHVQSVDTAHIVHVSTGNILEALLDNKRLLQIHRQQHLFSDVPSMSIDDVLREVVGNLLEPGLQAAGHGQDLGAQERDLHFLLVRKLKATWERLLPALAAFLSHAEEDVLEASLASDDCGSALSALQTRGRTLSSETDDAWTEVMSSIVPMVQNLVFKDGELAVAEEMKQAMGGACLRMEEYRTSTIPFSDFWQCGAESHDNFGDSAYTPSERVIDKLTLLSGVPLRTWARLHLHSGNESDALYGKWCGMPAPPEHEDEMGRPVGARTFWEECVMRNAGYFNALVCDTNGSYSVLGLAALNHGVCYPAHNHDNQEAYWQLGGPGWWKTWPKSFHKQPNERPYSEIRVTSPSAGLQLHNHPGGVVHEMDTTHDDDYLLTVYWWGKPAGIATNYAYSHNVQEQGSCFKTYRTEHADVQHSCPNPYRPPWAPMVRRTNAEP